MLLRPLSHVLSHVHDLYTINRLILGYCRISRVGWPALNECRRHSCNAGRPTRDILQYPMINLYILHRRIKTDQSDHFRGVEYFSILHPNIPPLELGMLVGCVITDTSMRVWILVETRVNKDGYFVVLTYPTKFIATCIQVCSYY